MGTIHLGKAVGGVIVEADFFMFAARASTGICAFGFDIIFSKILEPISTGPYWKPLYNIFEMEGLEVIVVNAQHMKALMFSTDMSSTILVHRITASSIVKGRSIHILSS